MDPSSICSNCRSSDCSLFIPCVVGEQRDEGQWKKFHLHNE